MEHRLVIPSAALLVLTAALAVLCGPAAAEKHNVLEHFPAPSSIRVALASAASHGIHITYNTSKLHGSGQWVRSGEGYEAGLGNGTALATASAKLYTLKRIRAFSLPLATPGRTSLSQITVSWSGVPSPDPSDLLAVYRRGGAVGQRAGQPLAPGRPARRCWRPLHAQPPAQAAQENAPAPRHPGPADSPPRCAARPTPTPPAVRPSSLPTPRTPPATWPAGVAPWRCASSTCGQIFGWCWCAAGPTSPPWLPAAR